MSDGHFIVLCRLCKAVIAQCRCMGPKETTYSVCDGCKRKAP